MDSLFLRSAPLCLCTTTYTNSDKRVVKDQSIPLLSPSYLTDELMKHANPNLEDNSYE